MQSRMFKKIMATPLVLATALLAGHALAADVTLTAEQSSFDVGTEASPNPITAWRFLCDQASLDAGTCVQDTNAPPVLRITAGDSLNLSVVNNLPQPISVMMPGMSDGSAPTLAADGRVQSFAAEVAPGGTGLYSYTTLDAGTYLFHSGTFPSLQVPMGLYGGLIVDADSTDPEVVLLFSELDPIQNGRFAAAAGGGALPTHECVSLAELAAGEPDGFPCTIDYQPMYNLVNGETQPNLSGFIPGSDVHLRMLNAGLRTKTPAFVNLEMSIFAEDGYVYPGAPKQQSHALLAAGKTLDAIVSTPATDVTVALLDRAPTFSDENRPTGGSLATIQVGTGSPDPIAANTVDVAIQVNEDESITWNPPGGNALRIVGTPNHGVAEELDDYQGSGVLWFRYTPYPDFSGQDAFTYYRPGTDTTFYVTVDVSPVNDAPVGGADEYVNALSAGIDVAAPGVLVNDADVDGDTLTAAMDTAPANGVVTCNESGTPVPGICADGSFSYVPNDSGAVVTDSFTYIATDDSNPAADSAATAVSLTVNPVSTLNVSVIDQNGNAVTDYRWTIEQDNTYVADPSQPNAPSLAADFHASYMPVLAQGMQSVADGTDDLASLALDPSQQYYISVLPLDAADPNGHGMGGARILPGATDVTVPVNTLPTPYAQISIFVFDDSAPTNGAVDGGEQGLGNFEITLEEAGGRYGASAGLLSQDADGNPLKNSLDCFGDSEPPVGIIVSCPDTEANRLAGVVGEVLITNLYPGKYGIITTPPGGATSKWIQTSTIEGTKVIDAWVKANEPAFFQEFGPAGWHAFVGFVNPDNLNNPGGGFSVSGRVTNMHLSRPPDQTLWDSTSYDALSHTQAWVGLNSAGGIGPNIAVVQADGEGNFTIPNVPAGDYQVVVWDKYLDQVIAYRGVTLTGAGGDVNVGNVPVFNWFSRLENWVFLDDGCGDPTSPGYQDGMRQPCEGAVPEQNVNIRWRDGTLYAAAPTDTEGFVPFDQVFPFFHWQVAEVDFARFKATGLTAQVDGGGDVSATGTVLNPQVQADGTLSRTETGAVLSQGFQGFLGQTNVIEWGKAPYQPGENGGISGIVYYASTRAESDPRLGVGEPWEPGVPRVKVRLYREVQRADGTTALALIDQTETDSWDDSPPEGCPGAAAIDEQITGGPLDKCYDGLRNFNQVRPGVFDGGYAFGASADDQLPPGKYIVEIEPPQGYTLVKEEDVNVAYGESYGFEPVPVVLPGGGAVPAIPDAAMVAAATTDYGLAQPPCVGTPRVVPDHMSLFPGLMEPAPFATATRPLCDRKEVLLSDQGQAAADFFLHTSAPIAAHFTGMVLDDIAQEFNPLSPQFGEKWAPPFVPVSIRDYRGAEISRTYSDQWGRINGLMPSTYSANLPSPSGYSPAMLMTCMNDPGPIPDPVNPGKTIVDPQYNPAYSNFCYTFQYMPGTTTYLDTPVLPVSAFASGYNPPDCAIPDGEPRIFAVSGVGDGPLTTSGGTLTIESQGNMTVPNPAYEGPLATGTAGEKTVVRNYSFGTATGAVLLDGEPLDPATVEWGPDLITWNVPADFPNGVYQLDVQNAAGATTVEAITVEVRGAAYINNRTHRVPADYATIQAAVDAADPGDIVLVSPGTYDELVILWKPISLQGSGAGSTIINAVKRPTEIMDTWRTRMDCLFGIGPGCTALVSPLPNQPTGAVGFDTEEGAAVTVVGIFDDNPRGGGQHPANSFRTGSPARIDGFSLTGGDTGGGIFVNGNAHRLVISNNRVFGNSGSYHGGIRVGRPFLELVTDGPYDFNRDIDIRDNAITQNGALGGAGGGISIATGTDRYGITGNLVCGNFSQGDGGGIGHFGLSDRGRIADNTITFNQSFMQNTTRSGGGLFIGGEAPADGSLTQGTGTVFVDSNTIRGNQAASGHGGGIRTQFVNGQEIINTLNRNGKPRLGQWWRVEMTNNMITNNMAGWSGAGISLQDTARSSITNNTVAHNDSTATVAAAFTGGDPNISTPQPAGISSQLHSATLTAAIPDVGSTRGLRDFSNPALENNIIWQNRSFHYDGTGASDGTGQGRAVLVPFLDQSAVGACEGGAIYDDLGVLGNGGFALQPVNSILTDVTGLDPAAGNQSADPEFAGAYCNGGRTLATVPHEMFALPALDEGGNTWIEVRFGPLTALGDYHLGAATSPAIGSADPGVAPAADIDGEPRTTATVDELVDIGADEFSE